MTNGNGNNSFSWGDALFLHIERPGQPLNIAGVSMFEGRMTLADLRAFIESKLPLIPRYRQRAVPSPFDFGLPSWELDPQFNIRNHVREVKLKHGTEDELKALAGKIVSQSLDRQRPLWDFTLARLKSGRTGMVTRIHHCLADGIAGVGAMNVIMDPSPDPPPVARKEAKPAPAPSPKDAGAALLDGLAKSYLAVQRSANAAFGTHEHGGAGGGRSGRCTGRTASRIVRAGSAGRAVALQRDLQRAAEVCLDRGPARRHQGDQKQVRRDGE